MQRDDPNDSPLASSESTAALFPKLALSLAAFVVVLVFLEIAARIFIANFASEDRFKHYATLQQVLERYEPKVTPHRYLGYYTTPLLVAGENKHNSLGFRGEEIAQPKPASEFRIVALGGSTTYTLAVKDHRLSYPALLENELEERGFENVTVVNAGVPGYSSWETLINLQFRVLDLDPDLLIIYHGVNDIHPRLVWPPSAYRGDNSGRSSPLDALKKPSIADYSTLARVLMIRANMIDSASAFSNSIDIFPDTYYGDAFMRQKRSGRYPEGIFEKVSAMDMLRANPPTYFERNLESVISIAKSRGIRVILATFAYSPRFVDRPRASSEEYVFAYREMNDRLRDIAHETDVDLFDFAKVFPEDEDYYTDGRHVTEAGSRLKARLFADHLASGDWLPRRP